jgi:DNA gyrase subunit A
MTDQVQSVALHEAASRRYLSYALSVITSRALPDVRDGLKPVQRRILYAMSHNLHLRPDARHRKSAAIVGEVMAKYHPHGDQSIYDAMVRLAQPFSQLHMLVDGQGNFGSLDGDPPAAMRYTEAKLRPLAMELLEELGQHTVDLRPNYDGQYFEPVVLPARFPQLLVNGCEGIAVGMATRVPPHNLREVLDACVLLIDDPEAPLEKVCRKVRGPDFPTGGELLNSAEELREIYATGQGSVTVRGSAVPERQGKKALLILTSIPYAQNKADLVKRIGELISERALPQLLDVRDESTDDVRVVLELRRPEDEGPALAYLYKHTPLQQRYHINLTALVPTDNAEVCVPARLNLRDLLKHWLTFRLLTVRRRFEHELRKLREAIHILEALRDPVQRLGRGDSDYPRL